MVGVIAEGQAVGVMKAKNPNVLATERGALVHGLAMLLLDGMLFAREDIAQGDRDPQIALARAIITDSLTSIVLENPVISQYSRLVTNSC